LKLNLFVEHFALDSGALLRGFRLRVSGARSGKRRASGS
jgi:hypothetical protein